MAPGVLVPCQVARAACSFCSVRVLVVLNGGFYIPQGYKRIQAWWLQVPGSSAGFAEMVEIVVCHDKVFALGSPVLISITMCIYYCSLWVEYVLTKTGPLWDGNIKLHLYHSWDSSCWWLLCRLYQADRGHLWPQGAARCRAVTNQGRTRGLRRTAAHVVEMLFDWHEWERSGDASSGIVTAQVYFCRMTEPSHINSR